LNSKKRQIYFFNVLPAQQTDTQQEFPYNIYFDKTGCKHEIEQKDNKGRRRGLLLLQSLKAKVTSVHSTFCAEQNKTTPARPIQVSIRFIFAEQLQQVKYKQIIK